jgi:hypothetical protein
MFYKLDVPEWVSVLKDSDYPQDFKRTFGAFLATLTSLLIPEEYAHNIINSLATAWLHQNQRDFLVDSYLPELQKYVRKIDIPLRDKSRILLKVGGLVSKLVYAFCYQEEYLKFPIF